MTRFALATAAAIALCASAPALAQSTSSPEDARVFFANLEDGAAVQSPVQIEFGIEGMEVVPAGTEQAGSGHHHLLIDRAPFGEGPTAAEDPIYPLPADDNHIHFGGGQTSVELELDPGTHTLQLVMGDHNHVPLDPPVTSEVIQVEVTE